MFNCAWLKLGIVCALPMCLQFHAQAVHSADIAYEIRQSNQASIAFELGLQAAYVDIPIVGWVSDDADDPTRSAVVLLPMFEGRAEWKGLFVETNSNSFSIFGLGYSPWNNDNTNVDLVLSDGLGQYQPNIGEFESVEKRRANVFAGIRATHNFENTVVQFEVHTDVSDRFNGQMAALQVGRFWQARNWSLHGLVGARYLSGNMLDYYFGISEQESTADVPRYKAGGGTMATLEMGATLPLSEKWIFKSTAQGFHLPDSVVDSPLADNSLGVILSTSISYVF